MQPRSRLIDNLRGIAVLSVVLYHFTLLLNTHAAFFSRFGFFGVKLFFVISGFLVYQSYSRNTERYGVKSGTVVYFLNRGFRILPAYYANLLIILLIVPFFITDYHFLFSKAFAAQIFENATLIAYFVYKDCGFGLNGAYWSLSVEMLWYLLVPFWFLYFRSIRRTLIIMLISVVYLVLLDTHMLDAWVLWAQNPIYHTPYSALVQYWSYQIPGQLIYFGIGILFSRVLNTQSVVNFSERISRYSRSWLVVFFTTLIGIFLIILSGTGRLNFNDLLTSNLYIAVAVTLVFGYFIIVPVYLPRWLSWVGKISYSIYLWHYPLLAISRNINVLKYVNLPTYVLIYLVLLFVLSAGSYYLVETKGFVLRDKVRTAFLTRSKTVNTETISSTTVN